MFVTQPLLDSYLDRHIDDICPTRYKAENHCAHFVSHVLKLKIGALCSTTGVSIRVHEIFASCPNVEQLLECRASYAPQLVFVTGEHNVNLKKHEMVNVPKKHIGIACGQYVWHYSNAQHKVVKQIVDTFLFHYKNQRNGLWLGSFPPGASPSAYGAG